MSDRRSAYDKHWDRLKELLGPEEAAAERKRMTLDEKADRHRKRVATFRKQLPKLQRQLAEAQEKGQTAIINRLTNQIQYRQRVLGREEPPTETAQT